VAKRLLALSVELIAACNEDGFFKALSASRVADSLVVAQVLALIFRR
jgi:hypothetical protein